MSPVSTVLHTLFLANILDVMTMCLVFLINRIKLFNKYNDKEFISCINNELNIDIKYIIRVAFIPYSVDTDYVLVIAESKK